MGYGQKLNISIKNERIVILENRAAAIEQLLFSEIKLSHKKMDENTAALKDLLGTLGNLQSELELIYDKLESRGIRGLIKKLASSIPNKGDKA
jgi:hypothetical protein